MGATQAFAFQKVFHREDGFSNYTKEAYELVTLVNQSYQALELGKLNDIHELRSAVEDVDSVKKLFMEKKFPADTESLGLAASISSTEELDTFERMVYFFDKKKPPQGIDWEMFTIEDGVLYLKPEEDTEETASLEAQRNAAIQQLIQAIEEVEALGLTAFRSFDSPIIRKNGKGYVPKTNA